MTYGAHYAHDMHDAENFGWEVRAGGSAGQCVRGGCATL